MQTLKCIAPTSITSVRNRNRSEVKRIRKYGKYPNHAEVIEKYVEVISQKSNESEDQVKGKEYGNP